MKVIRKKCSAENFEAVQSGLKPFDIQPDNEVWEVGDTLVLKEMEPDFFMSGRECRRTISYVLRSFDCDNLELPPGFVVLGLIPCVPANPVENNVNTLALEKFRTGEHYWVAPNPDVAAEKFELIGKADNSIFLVKAE